MAFTWSSHDETLAYGRYGNDAGWSGTTLTVTSSFANTEGALFLAVITTWGGDATAHTHSVSSVGGTAVSGATEIHPGSNPDTLWHDDADNWIRASLWSWTGTGTTGTLTVTLDSALDTDTSDGVTLGIMSASDTGPLTVIQSKVQNATNATASVTLDNAVKSGNECAYLAVWTSVFDDATPGTGWTELFDSYSYHHVYTMYEPTPSGAQNGQVSGIASMPNWSAIVEVGPTGFTGWGIPIS